LFRGELGESKIDDICTTAEPNSMLTVAARFPDALFVIGAAGCVIVLVLVLTAIEDIQTWFAT